MKISKIKEIIREELNEGENNVENLSIDQFINLAKEKNFNIIKLNKFKKFIEEFSSFKGHKQGMPWDEWLIDWNHWTMTAIKEELGKTIGNFDEIQKIIIDSIMNNYNDYYYDDISTETFALRIIEDLEENNFRIIKFDSTQINENKTLESNEIYNIILDTIKWYTRKNIDEQGWKSITNEIILNLEKKGYNISKNLEEVSLSKMMKNKDNFRKNMSLGEFIEHKVLSTYPYSAQKGVREELSLFGSLEDHQNLGNHPYDWWEKEFRFWIDNNKELREDKGSIKLKKDTPEQDIKKYTDKGFNVELNENKKLETESKLVNIISEFFQENKIEWPNLLAEKLVIELQKQFDIQPLNYFSGIKSRLVGPIKESKKIWVLGEWWTEEEILNAIENIKNSVSYESESMSGEDENKLKQLEQALNSKKYVSWPYFPRITEVDTKDGMPSGLNEVILTPFYKELKSLFGDEKISIWKSSDLIEIRSKEGGNKDDQVEILRPIANKLLERYPEISLDIDWVSPTKLGIIIEKESIKLEENQQDLIEYEDLPDNELIKYAHQSGIEKNIILDGEGGLVNREEIISLLKNNELNEHHKFTPEDQKSWIIQNLKDAGASKEKLHKINQLDAKKTTELYNKLEAIIKGVNINEDEKFHINSRNLKQTSKDLDELIKKYEEGDKTVAKNIKQKYKVKKELEQLLENNHIHEK